MSVPAFSEILVGGNIVIGTEIDSLIIQKYDEVVLVLPNDELRVKR